MYLTLFQFLKPFPGILTMIRDKTEPQLKGFLYF